MDYKTIPLDDWTEVHVSEWLFSIRIKKEYVDKLIEEEVSGIVLKEIDEIFLKNMGMKQGPIQLLLRKRDELLTRCNAPATEPAVNIAQTSHSLQNVTEGSVLRKPVMDLLGTAEAMIVHSRTSQNTDQNPKSNINVQESENSLYQDNQNKQTDGNLKNICKLENKTQQVKAEPLYTSNFRPFDKEVMNFKYVKNQVLSPETGIIDMITPCHEYKSLLTAVKLDRVRLQSKFACEVIRFASACMNVRTNGTIHFGIMDSVEDKGWKHGQIVGIPVNDKDWYVDALDYIEKCFFSKEHQAVARFCIRPPKFIEVIEKDNNEQGFVIEVDIVVPSTSVKGKVFQVSLPKFNEKSNKVTQEKKTIYQRVGAKSEPVSEEDNVAFIQGLQDVDLRREKAESRVISEISAIENLRRKSVLLTRGKEYIDEEQWYILVANKCESNHLTYLNFLRPLNIFCVFDFDADSDKTGLCSKYNEHHATNNHALVNYSNESGMSISELRKSLGLFDQTSWIFCNGRNNFRGGDEPCDENNWIKTKKKYLKKAVSLICDELFPKGSFLVIFLLLSPVEKTIVEVFHEFYAEMGGMEDIICIAENRDHFEKWASLAQASCSMDVLEQKSIVGIQLSHIDATFQNMCPLPNSSKNLPVSSKGVCILETPAEERMHSLGILCVNECSDKNLDNLSKEDVKEIEATFYKGGKISWKHLWLAEQKKCGVFIERGACNKVQEILNGILHENTVRLPVARIKIFHQPGSGGSTVARQILWKNRKELRCAIVKSSNPYSTVSQHAVKLREYDEKNPNQCLPVLLLVEDCDEDYLDDLRHELSEAMTMKKIASSKPCFILMSCKRSNAPEELFRVSPLETVAVTHKLNAKEIDEFQSKANELEKEFSNIEFLITFVLMKHEFDEEYVTNFVQNVMEGIDHSAVVTRLMRYVALLNCYVQNSHISVSHCEAFLGLGAYTKDQHSIIRQQNFKSCLNQQAKLLFIELKESTTYISSIQIIHPLVAKEVLNQLSGTRLQSAIAKDLLEEKVLLQHRFGRDEFIKFLRDLFLRRHRKSRGDSVDSFFSPLIEHICEEEKGKETAINLLKAAYERFDKDPFFAQQLARLCYRHEQFEEAKKWAEIAKSQLPGVSFILDTEGQVYKKWFNVIMDKKNDHTPEEVIELIGIGLKSMECFRAAQKAATSEMDSLNNSSYIGEVDLGCRMLHLLSKQPFFSKSKDRESEELLSYLLTEYIPKEIEKPWFKLHYHLKGLYQNIYNALEWIADDVGYFQSDKIDGEETSKIEEHIHSPRKWLIRKTETFAKFFSSEHFLSCTDIGKESQLVRKMTIYKLGGGSTATILSLLSDSKDERSGKKLENIIALYPQDISQERLDDVDLINYIMCHISLGCVFPGSSKILSFEKLRDLCKRFVNPRRSFPPSAYLLIFLLFWPDEKFDKKPDANKDNFLTFALHTAKRLHEIRIKNVPVRKKRTNVLFFHGKGHGLQKIMHRSKIEKRIEAPLNERKMKWINLDVSEEEENHVHRLLKAVHGWTENGKVYAQGHCKNQKIEILPLNYSSVPHGNENVTFYLGFTFLGLVAYNIQLQK
ncbi:sterile alpha motif domain-containing protein 9-like [Bombina bombina]|uniref:sterile alpha motif domain-containing protein 9-like n=1 Tax=Bombina bombina TaxID=8345 RepID=UPI00235B0029|nr:sterile alpha motif domain-containing protein 9-like [Bombina bombina]